MYPNAPGKQENNPIIQLMFLGLFAILGLIVFALAACIIVYLLYGLDTLMAVLSNQLNEKNVGAFKIILTAQQFGLFLTPAILLAVVERKPLNKFYGFEKPKPSLLLMAAFIGLCSLPFLSWVNELNQKMSLPAFLKNIEDWMRAMETDLAKTTEIILKTSSGWGLIVNLLVIAVTPAICEEFIFRGGLQRSIFRLVVNPHVAIWLSAIIFSSIHFQFFGFFTRMFLGATFGYLYFWTGSIWYAVFAHFLNNAYAVFVAYYYQSKNLPLNESDMQSVPLYMSVISAILTVSLLLFIKKKASQNNIQQPYEN
ncbi:CPBP family intramembrane glutamic endopeptidase [Pedobacter montanisoli]|uniref:CPBP family intramembrane metalloprotease n=1 Tax=Pedobacter montanisoli TaxID=2923277 RepID=A0ABS9ZT01_9SPHI|nr:CPBP family intramembrane glutamic endopeptidase [Pedobacter montanisoli]MCJ0741725.1 CPBP family intramembrane metalloprotease [Pedobacter montanisoli]